MGQLTTYTNNHMVYTYIDNSNKVYAAYLDPDGNHMTGSPRLVDDSHAFD